MRIGGSYVAPPRLTPEERAELREAARRIWSPHEDYSVVGFDLGKAHRCGGLRGIRWRGRESCRRCGEALGAV